MNRALKIFASVVMVGWLAGCGPSVIVSNNTRVPVRVIVTTGAGREALSPTPGESSSVDAAEGPYSATAIPDDEWIAYAKAVRKDLNEQLANSDKLTGPQLLDVIRRLKDIAARMQQYENAAGSSAKCGGTITQDSGGVVTVSVAADGKLILSCK